MITPSYALTATERVLPKLALDFTTASLDPRITFTRSLNTATRVNSSGNIETVNADLPRFDYDPTTLACKGLLIEESRINSCQNNTMVGAAAGTPGTLPIGWAFGATGGLSTSVVGSGTEKGISYIDLRIFGTSSSTFLIFSWQAFGTVAAVQNQTWSSSFYVKLVGGSLTNVGTIRQFVVGADAGGAALTTGQTVFTPTNASLINQRIITTTTLTNASTAFVYPRLDLLFNSGVAIDVTLRIGMPQLELGAFSTSVIPTSSGVVTRNADVATMTGTNFSSWFNASEGTIGINLSTPMDYSTGFQTFYTISDGTNANRIAAVVNSGANVINAEMIVSSSATAGFYPSYISGSTKLFFAYKENNTNYAKDSVTGTTDTTCTVPTMNRLNIGSSAGSGNLLNGHVQKVFYYPQRLLNAELAAFSK